MGLTQIERRHRIRPATLAVLAVDNLGLLRMQFQATLSESPSQDITDFASLLLRMTMEQSVIRVATPRNRGEIPGHPGIKHVVQEQIAQQRTDHPALRGAL